MIHLHEFKRITPLIDAYNERALRGMISWAIQMWPDDIYIYNASEFVKYLGPGQIWWKAPNTTERLLKYSEILSVKSYAVNPIVAEMDITPLILS